jgi:hypothetical protein
MPTDTEQDRLVDFLRNHGAMNPSTLNAYLAARPEFSGHQARR